MREIPPPRATRDLLPPEAAARRRLEAQFAETAGLYGFQPVETPMYERLELFLAHAGPAMRSALLTFHCDHEDFALRPELTAPVCRLLAAGELDGLPQPYRLYYTGSCFRYVRPGSGRMREFTQAGLELMGDPSARADAEVIAAAKRFLKTAGLGGAVLKIGTVGIFRDLLPAEMTPDDRKSIIGHLDQLVSIRERCALLAQSGDKVLFDDLRMDRKELAELQERAGYDGEYAIADHAAVDAPELAERLPLEAEATLRNAWAVEELVPEKRAETLIRISRLRGSLEQVLEQARKDLANTPATGALERLVEVCREVELYGIRDYEVVVGIARGLTFYTGTVFEFTTPAAAGARKYGGGGRYDGLAEVFGAEPTPSMGCAFRFDTLMAGLESGASEEPYQLALSVADGAEAQAVELAEALRDRGVRVGFGDGAETRKAVVNKDGVEMDGRRFPLDAGVIAGRVMSA